MKTLTLRTWLCLFVFLIPHAVMAQPEEQPVFNDYPSIESLGVNEAAAQGGLYRDIWKDVKRSHLNALLTSMPASSENRAVQSLIFGALLSKTSAKEIENDIEPRPGEDILTLRLQKLNEGGAFKQALALYEGIEGDPYHENLAQQGILAMLFSGEKSLACIEAETLAERFPQTEAVEIVLEFCQGSPSGEQDRPDGFKDRVVLGEILDSPEYRFTYDQDSFEELSSLEQAVLVAEKRLRFPDNNLKPLKSLPPAHLAALLNSKGLTSAQQTMALILQYQYGLAGLDDLKAHYMGLLKPASGEDSAGSGEDLGHFETLAKSLQSIENNKDPLAKWAELKKILPYSDTYGYAALAPFTAPLTNLSPEKINAEESHLTANQVVKVWKIFHAAGKTPPLGWVDAIDFYSAENIEEINAGKAVLLQALYKNGFRIPSGQQQNIIEKLQSTTPGETSQARFFAAYIIENIDKTSHDFDNETGIYEKEFILTSSQDYVMPSVQTWNRLRQSGESRKQGEAVLLSTIVLRDVSFEKLYPGVLHDVLITLNSVGLTNIAQNLVIAGLLEDI